MAPSPLTRTVGRPAPPSPRLKSMFDTEIVPGNCLPGSELVAGATCAINPGTRAADVGVPACTALIAATSPMASPAPVCTVKGRREGRGLLALNPVIVLSP